MATESPIRTLEGTDKWPTLKQSTRYGPSSAKTTIEDISLFLKSQRFQSFEKDVIPSRSESAPPSMEGSIAAIETIFSQRKSGLGITSVNSETDLLFHANLPLASHLGQRSADQLNSSEISRSFQPGGNSGADVKLATRARYAGESLRLHRSSLPAHEEESEDDQSSEHSASISVEKASSLGYPGSSLDLTQEDLQQASSSSYDQYSSIYKSTKESVVSDADNVSASISASGRNVLALENTKQMIQVDPLADSIDASTSKDTAQISSRNSSDSMVVKPSVYGKGLDAAKFDKQNNLPIGGATDIDEKHKEDIKSVGASRAPNSESHRAHKKENLTQTAVLQPQESGASQVPSSYSQIIYPGQGHAYGNLNHFHYGPSNVSTSEIQPLLQQSGLTHPLFATTTPYMTSPSPFYPNLQPTGFFTPQYNTSGYAFNSAFLPSYLSGYSPQGSVPTSFDNASFSSPGGVNLHAYDAHNAQKFYGQVGNPVQPPFADAFHFQYFQQPVRDSYGSFDPQFRRGGPIGTQVNAQDPKKGTEVGGLSNDYRPQHLAGTSFGDLNMRNKHMSSHYSFGSPTNVVPLVQFPPASVASPVVQTKSPGRSNLLGGRYNMNHSNSISGNTSRNFGYQSQGWNEMNSYTFLEELKSGKGQRFGLSDIAGHIGEFSIDQHGSRFIQQKLENCSDEEKAAVFKEVIPHASKLITDVFGNYVIQKLFDYGSPEQIRDLADQLQGQILQLSLQMYGCRVIQKVLEVIDKQQKGRLVKELDGHVVRCVRDQNGNHVIQKCIESIPVNSISFIISSFRSQVAALSMHPYGCRVIQRILEHCHDDLHTQFIVDEILDSVCSLAQDQYGNYVTQHVLERGKARERTEIIQKLAGSVVQLSQHKFASNVVEKCLEYSDASDRDVLIKEIVGDGDKSDNLLVMVKDQYANYVIQKILQKCTSEQREMLLGLIRDHLVALKKYTYGKHIVARFEQLYGEEIQNSES